MGRVVVVVLVVVVAAVLAVDGFANEGKCYEPEHPVDCNEGKTSDDYDKVCRKGNTNVCMTCSPRWFLHCDCDHCRINLTTAGVVVVSLTAVLVTLVVVGGVVCSCHNCAGCPLYRPAAVAHAPLLVAEHGPPSLVVVAQPVA